MFEGIKKLWQEAKRKAEEVKEFAEDDNRVIKMPPAVFEHEHETIPVDLSKKSTRDGGCSPPSFGDDERGTSIDKEIAVLVAEMNRVGIKTTCSCQGHDGGESYVSIRLGEGTTYIHRKDIFGRPGLDELTLRWRRK